MNKHELHKVEDRSSPNYKAAKYFNEQGKREFYKYLKKCNLFTEEEFLVLYWFKWEEITYREACSVFDIVRTDFDPSIFDIYKHHIAKLKERARVDTPIDS